MNKRILIIIGIIASILILTVLVWFALKPEASPSDEPVTPEEEIHDQTPGMTQEELDQIQESNRLNAPAVYLHNKLPIVEETFIIDSYIDRERESTVFTILPKIESLQEVQQDVLDYLLSIGLTEGQINSLIIEYTGEVN